jgi:hypothetical protein
MTTKITLNGCILSFFSFISLISFGQQKSSKQPATFGRTIQINENESVQKLKCATTEYDLYLRDANIKRNTNQEFESWLAPKIQRLIANQNDNSDLVLTIPVVVHVIHNNKAYGVQENILDEQIQSQITVLNQDFRKLEGTPGFNLNPVGADIKIEFCMAQRDPDGNVSNGINRVSLSGSGPNGWEFDDVETTVKPQTQWNPNDYLNIWVVEGITLFGFFEILGYAQFPTNSTLDGLDMGSSTLSITDGVVIGHKYLGSAAVFSGGTYDSTENDGRTATHEVGHWLGLRHIWGDTNACFDDGDYCDDTPPATGPNETCSPNFSCGAFNMIENYMDYTPAGCQNVFTQDQKARMRTVMQYAPRRLNLLNSEACFAPQTYGFDLEITADSLGSGGCSSSFNPVVLLRNKGTINTITSATITYSFNNGANETFNWTGSLLPSEEIFVTLPEVTFAAGNHTAIFELTSINNGMDDYTFNNKKYAAFETFESNMYNTSTVQISITTDGYGDETTWLLAKSNGEIVASGGPYDDDETYTQSISVDNNECYEFTIFDDFGDGICCTYGQGSYALTTSNGQIIANGGAFGAFEKTTFGIDLTMSSEDFLVKNISLYPNPTQNQVTIAIQNGVSLPENVTIFNTMGQTIISKSINQKSDLTMDVSQLSTGIYFIRMNIDNQNIVLRFLKN